MIGLALLLGGVCLVVGLVAAFLLRALPSLRLQVAALALVSVLLSLGVVAFSGLAMYKSGTDTTLVLVSALSALAAVGGGLWLARDLSRRVAAVTAASVRLAGGDLEARAPAGGPSELAELAASFNSMAEALDGIFRARRDLVTWASHDLRAPVTSLQVMVEALEDGLVSPAEFAATTKAQVGMLRNLVDDLFELSCLDTGGMRLEVVPTEALSLAASALARHQADASHAGISLIGPEQGSGVQWVACDADKIDRVLDNLLVNGLRHTPSGGEVRLEVTGSDAEVVLGVSDTGEGMPPDGYDRAFEPFWRADRARSAGSAGLGLTIAKGLILAQGGRIWAEPRPGGGTVVSFTLARAEPPAQPQREPSIPSAERAS